METEGSLLVVMLCLVSAVTQELNKNLIAFLGRGPPKVCQSSKNLEEALQNFANPDLDSYEGQVILKDKFLSQCASNIRIKLQQLQQQDSASSLDEMVQTATNIFKQTGEGGQDPGKGKRRDKVCPDAGCPPGKPYGKPWVLEGQGMRQTPNL